MIKVCIEICISNHSQLNFSDGQAEVTNSSSVPYDRTILVNSLEPGKTYTVILVASDGILAKTKSDPQMVTTLSKGMF
jgi:hypothetical protein